jgi:hypothetical protein
MLVRFAQCGHLLDLLGEFCGQFMRGMGQFLFLICLGKLCFSEPVVRTRFVFRLRGARSTPHYDRRTGACIDMDQAALDNSALDPCRLRAYTPNNPESPLCGSGFLCICTIRKSKDDATSGGLPLFLDQG